jgi:hypothetical protein
MFRDEAQKTTLGIIIVINNRQNLTHIVWQQIILQYNTRNYGERVYICYDPIKIAGLWDLNIIVWSKF